MRRNMSLICLAAALGLALLPLAARAERAVDRFQGNSAIATFRSIDSANCVSTYTGLFMFADRHQAPPGPPEHSASIQVFIAQYDRCQETWLMDAEGTTQGAPG